MTARKTQNATVAEPRRATGTRKTESVRPGTRGEKRRTSTSQIDQPPVPLEKHYEVFKGVEDRVKDRLAGLQHPYYFTGLRVAYDLKDSSNEPYKMPHSFEFGDLSLLDLYIKCGEQEELTEEDLRNMTKNAAIQYDFLKDLYEGARTELQGSSAEEIRVGVYIVLNGSREQDFAMVCGCNRSNRFASVPRGSDNQLRTQQSQASGQQNQTGSRPSQIVTCLQGCGS